jgi:murein DD-endopeptidase MepM/ murein hydrolase activator NlpD
MISSGIKLGNDARAIANQVSPDFCQKILFPVNAPITSPFGMRKHPITGAMKQHNGIDFGADQGTAIAAPLSGKVKTVGSDPSGYGNYLILDHGKGLETLYGHTSKILVTEGMLIAQGTAIALVGSTGSSTAPHLHWKTMLDHKPTNPENWINTEWGTRCTK